MAFYELRQYKVFPGKLDGWVKIMEEEIIPFQVSKGMVICGSFRGETDESVYVWIRRFDSEEQRVALYRDVYESDYWKTKIAPRVPEYLDRPNNVVTRIVPTPRSPVQIAGRQHGVSILPTSCCAIQAFSRSPAHASAALRQLRNRVGIPVFAVSPPSATTADPVT